MRAIPREHGTKRQHTVTAKILLSTGAMLALAAVSSAVAVHAIKELTAALNASMAASKKLANAERIRTLVYQMRFAQRGISLGLYEELPKDLAKAKNLFADSGKQMLEVIDGIRPLLVTERGRRISDEIERKLTRWRELGAEMNRLADAGDVTGLSKLRTGDVRYLADDIDGSAKILIELQVNLMDHARADATVISSRAYTIQIVLLAVLALAGVLAVVVVRRMSCRLRGVAARIREGSKGIAAAARQLSSNGRTLSEGASEQAAAIEQTSASTEEINAMSRKNGDNTQQAAQLMTAVDREMQTGTATLDEVLSSMSLISDSSGNISKIIKVIDEIAFQTNILALNAAVEAARAGEAGTGFAVVAEEVRNLAGRCAQAAKDSEGLIGSSLNQARDGSAKVEKLSGVVKSIAAGSRQAKTLIDEVQVASEQQSQGMQQIATAVSRMEQVTQRTAASAEQGAAASQELSSQAENLNSEASRLEQLVGADTPAA